MRGEESMMEGEGGGYQGMGNEGEKRWRGQ